MAKRATKPATSNGISIVIERSPFRRGREGAGAKHASRSDLEGGAKAREAGIWGASRNVAVNLPGIEDEGFRRATGDEAARLAARAAAMIDQVLKTLASRTE